MKTATSKFTPKTLALDYGTKRIGVAVSYGTLAEPLKVVANFSNPGEKDVVTQEALQELLKIILKEKIEQIVIGLSENAMAEKIEEFLGFVRKFLMEQMSKEKIPQIELFDETLSSNEVHRRLSQKGIKFKKRQGEIDHYAAAVILEEWMEGF